MAYRIAPDSDASWGDTRVRRCPVADVNRLAPIIEGYHQHRAGLLSLREGYPAPSCAVVDLWTVLHQQTELMLSRSRERAAEETRHG